MKKTKSWHKTKTDNLNARQLTKMLREVLTPCYPKVFKKPVYINVRTEMLARGRNSLSKRRPMKVCYVSFKPVFRKCPYLVWVPLPNEVLGQTAVKLALAIIKWQENWKLVTDKNE